MRHDYRDYTSKIGNQSENLRESCNTFIAHIYHAKNYKPYRMNSGLKRIIRAKYGLVIL